LKGQLSRRTLNSLNSTFTNAAKRKGDRDQPLDSFPFEHFGSFRLPTEPAHYIMAQARSRPGRDNGRQEDTSITERPSKRIKADSRSIAAAAATTNDREESPLDTQHAANPDIIMAESEDGIAEEQTEQLKASDLYLDTVG
jgi:hypothetical protein